MESQVIYSDARGTLVREGRAWIWSREGESKAIYASDNSALSWLCAALERAMAERNDWRRHVYWLVRWAHKGLGIYRDGPQATPTEALETIAHFVDLAGTPEPDGFRAAPSPSPAAASPTQTCDAPFGKIGHLLSPHPIRHWPWAPVAPAPAPAAEQGERLSVEEMVRRICFAAGFEEAKTYPYTAGDLVEAANLLNGWLGERHAPPAPAPALEAHTAQDALIESAKEYVILEARRYCDGDHFHNITGAIVALDDVLRPGAGGTT